MLHNSERHCRVSSAQPSTKTHRKKQTSWTVGTKHCIRHVADSRGSPNLIETTLCVGRKNKRFENTHGTHSERQQSRTLPKIWFTSAISDLPQHRRRDPEQRQHADQDPGLAQFFRRACGVRTICSTPPENRQTSRCLCRDRLGRESDPTHKAQNESLCPVIVHRPVLRGRTSLTLGFSGSVPTCIETRRARARGTDEGALHRMCVQSQKEKLELLASAPKMSRRVFMAAYDLYLSLGTRYPKFGPVRMANRLAGSKHKLRL